jgi:hypothetical protein
MTDLYSKHMISAPVRIVGELKTEKFRIGHIWPNVEDPRVKYLMDDDSPNLWLSYSVSTFGDSPVKWQIKPEDEWMIDAGQKTSMLAALWFGKRFEYNGLIWTLGDDLYPTNENRSPIRHKFIYPHNKHTRKDGIAPLNWETMKGIIKLLDLSEKELNVRTFWRATWFYKSGINSIDTDAEKSFVMFTSVLEFIAKRIAPRASEFKDDNLNEAINKVNAHVPSPDKKDVLKILSRGSKIGARIKWVCEKFLNDVFFAGTEIRVENGEPMKFLALKKDDLGRAIDEVYMLRSQFLHAGKRIEAVGRMMDFQNEIQLGVPIDRHKKPLVPPGSLTILGLERIVRFVLLAYVHNYITPLHDSLRANP